jgi:hypothetical protein
MTTRKLGLPIDPSQDVISECYDSWYAFFKVAREMIKTIPLHKNPRSEQMRQFVHLSQAILNDGLRPHLQRWQARFREWSTVHRIGATQKPTATPQELQQLFPDWAELRDDLLATNQRLIAYVGALETVIGFHNRAVNRAPRTKRSIAAVRNRTTTAGAQQSPASNAERP